MCFFQEYIESHKICSKWSLRQLCFLNNQQLNRNYIINLKMKLEEIKKVLLLILHLGNFSDLTGSKYLNYLLLS